MGRRRSRRVSSVPAYTASSLTCSCSVVWHTDMGGALVLQKRPRSSSASGHDTTPCRVDLPDTSRNYTDHTKKENSWLHSPR